MSLFFRIKKTVVIFALFMILFMTMLLLWLFLQPTQEVVIEKQTHNNVIKPNTFRTTEKIDSEPKASVKNKKFTSTDVKNREENHQPLKLGNCPIKFFATFQEQLQYLKGCDADAYVDFYRYYREKEAQNNKVGIYDNNGQPYKDYMLYDNKTLIELINSGDLLAVQVLIKKLDLEDENNIQDATIKAGIFMGSAYAANHASISLHVSAELDTFETPQDRNKQLKNSLIYNTLSMMYGDSYTDVVSEKIANDKMNLTKAEWQDIRSASDKLYNNMNELRVKNGFAPFQHTDKYKIVNKFEQELLSNGLIK